MAVDIESLLEIRGVRHAALLAESGAVMEAAGRIPDLAVLGAAQAVSTSLVEALGGEFRDMVVDFEDGPVLFTSLGNRTLFTAFDDVANLGRLRFALRRAIPELRAR
ncbi:roadblock/LC7 domain-containing protein [Deinococcus pimensis]|uniref:roadblock/LC7 domain-containing protein n=1 Tax=Deinococcus pimensis TaxID=309888 RepID=UPI0004893824|nr:roadblock/LC7 domain-containing protein [Deinococcus pimensis]